MCAGHVLPVRAKSSALREERAFCPGEARRQKFRASSASKGCTACDVSYSLGSTTATTARFAFTSEAPSEVPGPRPHVLRLSRWNRYR